MSSSSGWKLISTPHQRSLTSPGLTHVVFNSNSLSALTILTPTFLAAYFPCAKLPASFPFCCSRACFDATENLSSTSLLTPFDNSTVIFCGRPCSSNAAVSSYGEGADVPVINISGSLGRTFNSAILSILFSLRLSYALNVIFARFSFKNFRYILPTKNSEFLKNA